ncbi:unnamed protein product (macronuclear) [Paramecium tetraurelia]|uniref:FYVE-type domain-containing protein n=1 Tax=Paramecium tetraurelia TaxID=5888 RepID=A0EEF6_PARTE|nr:uncharacterized protein GSPATT00026019001 [Paramecium tetraurelia]CAK93679.1 unnamed protein product [Paramecium tetraurelia]|eukprot:XP_001461070.1 hypothetical protein (macronuclear) [Paramecium tetraurelia strain d4-2]
MNPNTKAQTRQKQPNCEICMYSFLLSVQQHQCKRCLRAICSECGKYKGLVVNFDLKQEHRVCLVCKDEQEYLEKLINEKKLQYNNNSLNTKEWLQYSCIDKAKEKIINDYYYIKLEESKNNLSQLDYENLKLIKPYVIQIRSQFKYSIIELDYYLTKYLIKDLIKEKTQAEIKESLDNTITDLVFQVLQCFIYDNPSIKCTYNLVQLTQFLLYFHSQPLVLYFINILRKEGCLKRLLENAEQLQSSEIDILQEIGKTNHQIQQTDLFFFRKYLEKYANSMLSSLFIDYLNVPCIIYIFDRIFKYKNYSELEDITALLDIKLKGQDDEFITNQIRRNTKRLDLKKYLNKDDNVEQSQKRNTYTTYEDFFQRNRQSIEPQNQIGQILQLIDSYVLKQQPLTNCHQELIKSLNPEQVQIIEDLIKLQGQKAQIESENIPRSNSINQSKFQRKRPVQPYELNM